MSFRREEFDLLSVRICHLRGFWIPPWIHLHVLPVNQWQICHKNISLLNRWSLASYIFKPSCVCFNMVKWKAVIYFTVFTLNDLSIRMKDIQKTCVLLPAKSESFSPGSRGWWTEGCFWQLCVLNRFSEEPGLSIDSRGKQRQAGFPVSPLPWMPVIRWDGGRPCCTLCPSIARSV